jgi:hypothetical protein
MDLSDENLVNIWIDVLPELHKRLREGRLPTMPITTFGIENIRNALTYFQRAKHLGKIVVLYPSDDKIELKRHRLEFQSPLFNSRSLYLLVGGLGGIGLKV